MHVGFSALPRYLPLGLVRAWCAISHPTVPPRLRPSPQTGARTRRGPSSRRCVLTVWRRPKDALRLGSKARPESGVKREECTTRSPPLGPLEPTPVAASWTAGSARPPGRGRGGANHRLSKPLTWTCAEISIFRRLGTREAPRSESVRSRPGRLWVADCSANPHRQRPHCLIDSAWVGDKGF
jgi:hypothetical protein